MIQSDDSSSAVGTSNVYRRARLLYEEEGNATASLSAYNDIEASSVAAAAVPDADQGGSRAVLPADEYNVAVLRTLLSAAGGEMPSGQERLVHELPTLAEDTSNLPLTGLYNAALAAYSAAQYGKAVSLLLPKFLEQREEIGTSVEMTTVLVDVAFLLIDCSLALNRGDTLGLLDFGASSSSAASSDDTLPVDDVLTFIESYLATLASKGSDSDRLNELKFRHSVYKSRVLLSKRPKRNDVTNDKATRMARKDLKSAMEIYHHKLMTTGAGSISANTGADLLEEAECEGNLSSSIAAGGIASDGGTPDVLYSSQHSDNNDGAPRAQHRLDVQAQCALSLKANLEYLKGNARKALKLTAEARHAGERRRRPAGGADTNSTASAAAIAIDDALHLNNLALLHQTSGRNHAALHYYSRALSGLEALPDSPLPGYFFEADGTVLLSPLPGILHNSSICAFAVRNYATSYECMARAVRADPGTFGSRGRCWLRMAEACLGVHEELKAGVRSEGKRMFDEIGKFPAGSAVSDRDLAFRDATGSEGTTDRSAVEGIEMKDNDYAVAASALSVAERGLEHLSALSTYQPDSAAKLVFDLGSESDLKEVASNPLPRAIHCLTRAMELCNADMAGSTISDRDCIESAALSLAYVYLETGESLLASKLCNEILTAPSDPRKEPSLASRRRLATAKLYSCEARCMQDQAEGALQMLIDASSDGGMEEEGNLLLASLEKLDKSSRDLAYLAVPDEEVIEGDEEKEGLGGSPSYASPLKVRLDYAKSTVHAFAAAAAALSGDNAIGRAHALCALKTTPSDEIASSYNCSPARKTLLYCLLKEGRLSEALELLQSAGRRVGA